MHRNNYFRPVGNLSLFGAFLFLLFGASHRPQTTAAGIIDHFKVGDVVHSLLPPDDFQRLHGKGWETLDGHTINPASDLRRSFSSLLFNNGTALPDSRGVFLRGYNHGQSPSIGDPEGSARKVGSYQADAFKSHNHRTDNGTKWGNWTYGGNNWASQWQDGTYTQSTGGDETRPRNITLYIYIKTDEDGIY